MDRAVIQSRRAPIGVSLASTSGFTLVELIVALTISAILAGFIAMFVGAPVDAYFDQSERARLSESSEIISRKFGEDLRSVLPNSVRGRHTGARWTIEMLKVENVSFYLAEGDTGLIPPQSDIELKVGAAGDGDAFDIFGRTTDADAYLVMGHKGYGEPGADAYRMQDVILRIAVPYSGGKHHVQLPTGFAFPANDSTRRIFWVAEPVTYVCNSDARTLTRFSGYNISTHPPTSETSGQLSSGSGVSEVLATNIGSCSFRCENQAGDIDICLGTLEFETSVVRKTDSQDEVIRILERVPMDNRI